jgi:hypothetical protein
LHVGAGRSDHVVRLSAAGTGNLAVAPMVLTVPVLTGGGAVRVYGRRQVLRVVLGGAVAMATAAACDSGGAEPPPPPDPLTPFYLDTVALLARYDAVIAAQPALADRLGQLRDDHKAHVDALYREIGAPSEPPRPSATGQPAGDGETLATLSDAEKAAAAAAHAACLAGPGYRAALLGSIAACRASHVEALS